MEFKKRSHLCYIEVIGEAASTDVEDAANHPEDLDKVIDEGGCTKQHIFNVGEPAFYWKKMASRTFTAKREKSMSDLKVSKDRLTLLIGATAASDLELKPIPFFHSENPRALKNYTEFSPYALSLCSKNGKTKPGW